MIDPNFSEEFLNESKALTPEIYKDLAKPAVQEVGSVAGRTVKALLSPIRGMLWGWEQIEKIVEEGVKERFEKIPDDRKKSPNPEIAVPLIQALSYTAQNETLREMYINLLSNSMDLNMDKIVHPSFVEIIKQLNSLDAKVFDKISETKFYQKILNPIIRVKDKGQFFTGATPEWYIGWSIEGFNEFDISASLIRLSKFGLIELMYDRTSSKDGYDNLRSTPYLKNILENYKSAHPNIELEIAGTESLTYVNEYGNQFRKACK